MTLGLTRFCFTTAEYDNLIEAGILGEDDRVELIEGDIIQITPIGRRHAGCVNRLTYLLTVLASGDAQIAVQNPILLNELSEPQPDLVLLKPTPDFYSSTLPQPADILLLVEVADSSVAVDRQIKMPLYGRSGIQEAWLVDLEADVVTIYRDPTSAGYDTVFEARRGGLLTTIAFPSRPIKVLDILG